MGDKVCQMRMWAYLLGEVAQRALQSGPDGFRGVRKTLHDGVRTVLEDIILVLGNEVMEDGLDE